MLEISANLVSVIVPCFNQAVFLDECLTSVHNQTYPNWECIIVNDGSSDNTAELAHNWIKKDTRFKYLYKENGGLSSARNFGIENSCGTYILPLDADDFISTSYLKQAVQILNRQPNIKLVYGNARKFGDINTKWYLSQYRYDLLLEGNIIYCSGVYRKQDYLSTLGYDEGMLEGYEDWDFWLQLLNPNDQVSFINDTVFYYRIKNSSMLSNVDLATAKKLRHYIFDKHNDLFREWPDPILMKREIRSLTRMYKDSLAYKVGHILVSPFIKVYNLFR